MDDTLFGKAFSPPIGEPRVELEFDLHLAPHFNRESVAICANVGWFVAPRPINAERSLIQRENKSRMSEAFGSRSETGFDGESSCSWCSSGHFLGRGIMP